MYNYTNKQKRTENCEREVLKGVNMNISLTNKNN